MYKRIRKPIAVARGVGGVRARLTARLIAHALRGQSGRADYTRAKTMGARVHEKIRAKNTRRRTR